jgi:hypothetical protein
MDTFGEGNQRTQMLALVAVNALQQHHPLKLDEILPPIAATLASKAALAAATTLSTTSSSVMAVADSSSAASGRSICYSSRSTFSRAAMSHCSSTLSTGT